MGRMSCFGIGCFHFRPVISIPCRFSVDEYVQRVRKCLDLIDTVESHNIQAEDGVFDIEHIDERGFFPGHYLICVEFTIRIPFRVQADVVQSIRGMNYGSPQTGTERFRVTTRYYYHGPVTIVECLGVDDGGSVSPSNSVVVVREYMEEKVDQHGQRLQFETVGPSPFHADFSVAEDDSVVSFSIDHDQRYGYDSISFRVCPELLRNRTPWILDLMGHELSYFYSLARVRILRMDMWNDIETQWSEVRQRIEAASIITRLQGLFDRRTTLEALIRSVIDFRSSDVFEHQRAESGRKSLSRSGDCPAFLRQSVDEAFDRTFSPYPTDEMLSLAEFYENKKARRTDRFALLYAAVVGGVVGSFFTLLAGSL